MVMIPATMQETGDKLFEVITSGHVRATKTIKLVQRIVRDTVNVTRTPEYPVANTSNTTICVTIQTASHLTLTFDYGDGSVIETDTVNFPAADLATCKSHLYGTGEFNLVVTLENILSTEVFALPVQSFQPISDLTMTVSNTHVACPGGEVVIGIEKIDRDSDDPTDIFLSWDISGLDFDRADITLPHSQSLILPCSNVGDVVLNANISNRVSFRALNTTVTVQTKIQNPQLLVLSEFISVNELANFSVKLSEGSHAKFSVDFADISVYSFMHSNVNNSTVEEQFHHIFTRPGNYTVQLTASNNVTTSSPELTVTANKIVIVQTPFDVLKIDSDSEYIHEGGTIHVTLTVPSDNAGIADNVHMNWWWHGKDR